MHTILLIEDDPNQQALYRMELEDEGYRVAVASDGREGLWKVREERPDLVLLDLQMPGIDGIETLWRLMGADAQIPVIIHTAYEQYEDDFMTWMADAYVVKSSNPDVLKAEIGRALSAKQHENALEGSP